MTHTTDVRGVPVYRIDLLQDMAGSLGVAVALPQGYGVYDLEDMGSELSSMIEYESSFEHEMVLDN